MSYHEPVMAAEVLEALQISPDSKLVDATFGGGGHARLILQRLGDKGRLYGFDQDADAQANIPEDQRLIFVAHNFRHLQRFLKLHGARAVQGILADLGVSSHQFDVAERGFSYRFDGALDMRMNQAQETSARTVVNEYPEEELLRIMSAYGEVRNARTLVRALHESRSKKRIETIGDLLAVVEPVIRGQRNRYLSQVFQALRMEVNQELEALEDFLAQSLEMLEEGGRLVVLSYHSIEDRLVKNFMKAGNVKGKLQKDFYGNIYRPFRLIDKKGKQATDEEVANNPRARSARLRVAEKIASPVWPDEET